MSKHKLSSAVWQYFDVDTTEEQLVRCTIIVSTAKTRLVRRGAPGSAKSSFSTKNMSCHLQNHHQTEHKMTRDSQNEAEDIRNRKICQTSERSSIYILSEKKQTTLAESFESSSIRIF